MSARDIAIDPITGGVLLAAGDLQLVSDVEAIKQHARQRLQFFKGEWFLDLEAGMDFWGAMLVKGADPELVRGELSDAITGTPGIAELQQLELRFNRSARELSVKWSATTDTGQLISDTTGVAASAS